MSAATGEPTPATAGTEPSRRRACLFGKTSRILSRARFEALYALRTRRAGRFLVAYWDAAPADAAGHRLGATARSLVLERHTWTSSAQKLLALYQSLLPR